MKWCVLGKSKLAKPLLVILHAACLFLAAYATPPYHEVIITTDPAEGPYPFDTTVILTCSVTPPSPEGAIYSWTDSIPSTTLSSAQPNLTLTIPAHHPGQGHYYCTVSNGSTVLGVGSTTISVRSELDKQTMFGIVTSKSCLMKGLVNTIWVCSAMISCWQSLVVTDLT